MMKTGLIGIAALAALVVVGCGKKDGTGDAPKAESRSADKEVILSIVKDMVRIPGRSFLMGKFEVTQRQWEAVMGNTPSHFTNHPDNPVENVSWNDCKVFLAKLNALPEVKVSRLTFRLPTEAEWEYACRAGGKDQYCRLADGSEITESTLDSVAWFNKTSEGSTHLVGQKMPNAFGLYDMHGNVWEWCEDLYEAGSSDRVRRGGSWYNDNDSRTCTASNRNYYDPDGRYSDLGFRLAASQD